MTSDFAAGLFFVMAAIVGPTIIIVVMILRHKQRALIHRERIAVLEKGIEVPQLPGQRSSGPASPQPYMLRGLIWLFAGLALTFALVAISGTTDRPPTVEEKIRMTNNARSSGATQEEVQRLWEDNSPRRSSLPTGAAAAVGLIPTRSGRRISRLLRYSAKEVEVLKHNDAAGPFRDSGGVAFAHGLAGFNQSASDRTTITTAMCSVRPGVAFGLENSTPTP